MGKGRVFPAEIRVGHGGVVGVDRHEQAGVPHAPERMLQRREAIGDDDVGARADRQWDPGLGNAPDECGVLGDGDAVVDPLDPGRSERRSDALRADGGVLAGVAGETARCASARAKACEIARVDTNLGRVHADPDDAFRSAAPPQLDERLDHLEGGGRAERPVDVADEHAPRAGLRFRGLDAIGQAADDVAKALAGGQMPCGREERLAVAQAVGRGVDDGLAGDAGPVVRIVEELLDEPEDGQKSIERVVPVELGRILRRQPVAVLARQLDDGRRPDSPST